MGKNLKIYSVLVYCVNFILYCSALTLLTVGTVLVYSVMQIEQQELKKRKEKGKGKHTLLHRSAPTEHVEWLDGELNTIN
jgi:hypothetical protein